MEVLNNIWLKICEFYAMYSDMIHGVFPKQIGDLVEGVLDIAIVCLIIKSVSTVAFGTKNNG